MKHNQMQLVLFFFDNLSIYQCVIAKREQQKSINNSSFRFRLIEDKTQKGSRQSQMEDGYWDSSSVKKAVNQQDIFNYDESNSLDVSFSARGDFLPSDFFMFSIDRSFLDIV